MLFGIKAKRCWYTKFVLFLLDRSACFRPFRLMAGLLNRSEIGSLLVEHVLVDFVFFTLHMYHRLQRISGNGGGRKSPYLSACLSESSSPVDRRPKDQRLPQQTLEMLTQYDTCELLLVPDYELLGALRIGL